MTTRFVSLFRFSAPVFASIALFSQVQAASQTWTGATNGDFSVGTNWAGGTAPGLVNSGSANVQDVATFNNAVNTTITVDAGRNIGSIVFDLNTAGAFTLGGNTLWLTTSSATAGILMNNTVVTSQTINSNLVTTRTGLTFANNSTANPGVRLLLNGSFTGASGSTTTLTIGSSAGGNGNGVFSGAILNGTSGTLNLIKLGTGTWTLSGNNTYNGTTQIGVGTLSVSSVGTNLGSASTAIDLGSSSNAGTLLYTGTGETLTRTLNLAGTTGGGGVNSSGSGALVISSNFTASGTGSKALTLTGTNSGNNIVSGAIVDNSGVNKTSVIKDGTGKWILSGSSNTYTGLTRLVGGDLTLDYAAATAPVSNIINSSGTLALGISSGQGGVATSGTLNINGKLNTANTQSFAADTTAVGVGAFHVNLNPGGGSGTVTLNLGGLAATKVAGFSLDLGLAAGATVVSGSTANTSAGVLPQGTTVNGTSFATMSGSNVVAFSAYIANTGTTLGTSAQVVDMSGGVNTTLSAATTTVGALRFNNAAARTITLNSSTATLVVNGGILVTGSVGANASTINGGLLQGVNGRDLLIMQNNTSVGGALQIGSTIVQNTNGGFLTKSGAGDLILSGTNSYSAGNYLHEGKTIVTTDSLAALAKSGTSTAASAVLTGIDTTGLWIGQRVTASTLAGTNYYITAINSGSNTVTLNTGVSVTAGAVTFDMSAGSSLGSGTASNAVQIGATATLQIGNGGTTGNLLSTQGVVNNGILSLNRTNAFTYASITSGAGTIVQAGTGTTTLNGTHSYTGNTLVNAGTLLVNGSVASSAAVVNTNGSLGGSGTVASIVLNLGGAVTPGNSIGTLNTNNGALVWNGQTSGTFGQMKFELANASNSSDLLNLGLGVFDKGTGSVFSFDFLGTGGNGFTYTLVNFGSTDFSVGDFSYTNLASGLSGTFVQNANTLQFVTNVIPEPSTALLVGIGLAFAFGRSRRRVIVA